MRQRPPKSLFKKIEIPLYSVIFGIGTMYLMLVFSLPFLDRIDERWIECTVVSADSGVASGGTRGGVSTHKVSFETSDCGLVGLTWGVTKDNKEAIAASVVPGEKYEFLFKWSSIQMVKEQFPFSTMEPTAEAFRPSER